MNTKSSYARCSAELSAALQTAKKTALAAEKNLNHKDGMYSQVEGWDLLNGLYQVIPEAVGAALAPLLEKCQMAIADLPWKNVDHITDLEVFNASFSIIAPSGTRDYLGRADKYAQGGEIQSVHLLQALLGRMDDSLHTIFQNLLRDDEATLREDALKAEKELLPIKVTYSRTSQSNHGYKVRGTEALKLKLNTGEIVDIHQATKDEAFLERTGIEVTEKHEWKEKSWDLNIQTYTVTITIHEARAFPLAVHWIEEDYYTMSGYGTSGDTTGYVTRWELDGDEIKEKTIYRSSSPDFK